MKKEDLKDKTLEKLTSDLTMLKATTGALSGILLVLFTVTVYGLLSKKDDKATFISLMVVAISCSAVIPFNIRKIKQIKKELSLRERI